MDRRSWLWRRKSSDKSSGETESLGSGSISGSMSSPSERFSDEQQAYLNQIAQSPEVTSKSATRDDDTVDSVKILGEKLSAAVATINEKEELVKQHAKVAEEAVTGWERAETEVTSVKQQFEAAIQRNTSLEDRIVHLDGALKECLRQLRQVKEEQDQRIQEAVAQKSQDVNGSSELDGQLVDLRAQLETVSVKAEAAASLESDLRLKLARAEKENASLQLELGSRLEELEVTTLERDLSTKTAEAASKQHLESIKKVAKLEAECRRLKAMARKTTSSHDHRSVLASASQVTSFSQSSKGELDLLSHDKAPLKSHMPPPPEVGLLDDFLEMEKLAAQPARENTGSSFRSISSVDEHNGRSIDSASSKSELEAMINRTAELEEKLEMVEEEKIELGLALSQCQDKLELSEGSLAKLQAQFNECQNQLRISQAQLRDANKKLGMLQAELDLASELRQAIDLELDDANVRREEAEMQRKAVEKESEILLSKVTYLEDEAEKERTLYEEASAKCRVLEDELSTTKHEAETLQSLLFSLKDSKEAVERELQSIIAKKQTAESQLSEVQAEVKFLLAKIGSLEHEAEKEKILSADFGAKCRRLENEVSRMEHEAEQWQSQSTSANDTKEAVTRELQMANAKKAAVESELKAVQAEAETLVTRIGTLEHEMRIERTSSAEFAAKCKKLESEILEMKSECGFRFSPLSKEELNKQQEKELAVAASKFAECQKTIASLGNQLKSLATLEDIFLDSDKLIDASEKELQHPAHGVKPVGLHSSSSRPSVMSDLLHSETTDDTFAISKEDCPEDMKDYKEQLSSLTIDKNNQNGFTKLLSRARSTVRTQT